MGYVAAETGPRETCVAEMRLPPGYPSQCPPSASFEHLAMGCDEAEFCDRLEALFVERLGQVVLYDWILEVQQRLQVDYKMESLL